MPSGRHIIDLSTIALDCEATFTSWLTCVSRSVASTLGPTHILAIEEAQGREYKTGSDSPLCELLEAMLLVETLELHCSVAGAVADVLHPDVGADRLPELRTIAVKGESGGEEAVKSLLTAFGPLLEERRSPFQPVVAGDWRPSIHSLRTHCCAPCGMDAMDDDTDSDPQISDGAGVHPRIESHDSPPQEAGPSRHTILSAQPAAGSAAAHLIPYDILLEIFASCLSPTTPPEEIKPFVEYTQQEWLPLAHVCAQWRKVVLQGSVWLGLRLRCDNTGPWEDKIAHSLPVPLFLYISLSGNEDLKRGLALLQHIDRAPAIEVRGSAIMLRRFFANARPLMESARALRQLGVAVSGSLTDDGIPTGVLEGDAPALCSLRLEGVTITRSTLLQSAASSLTFLRFIDTKEWCFPVDFATSLREIPRLQRLNMYIWQGIPEWGMPRTTRRLNSGKLLSLPNLSHVEYVGAGDWFDEFAASIDAPLLTVLNIKLLARAGMRHFQQSSLAGLVAKMPIQHAHGIDLAIDTHDSTLRLLRPGNAPPSVILRSEGPYMSGFNTTQLEKMVTLFHSFANILADIKEFNLVQSGDALAHLSTHPAELDQFAELLVPLRGLTKLTTGPEVAVALALALQRFTTLRPEETVLPTLKTIHCSSPPDPGMWGPFLSHLRACTASSPSKAASSPDAFSAPSKAPTRPTLYTTPPAPQMRPARSLALLAPALGARASYDSYYAPATAPGGPPRAHRQNTITTTATANTTTDPRHAHPLGETPFSPGPALLLGALALLWALILDGAVRQHKRRRGGRAARKGTGEGRCRCRVCVLRRQAARRPLHGSPARAGKRWEGWLEAELGVLDRIV
ncbi:hypothetical protein BC834DRAFT_845611 [Gloeopeniophorella convolvens]|nr:hypothetical protein BC834DRAFT_845611 [Gloeopeniophorella convolvens]